MLQFWIVALIFLSPSSTAWATAVGGVDISPLVNSMINIVAAVILAASASIVGILANKLRQWFNVQIDKSEQDKITAIAQQELMKGVVASKALIEEKGWDHAEVHSQVAAIAINAADAALTSHGLNSSDPATIAKMESAVQAQLPAVFTQAAASPATPAAPPPDDKKP